jgi:drug/metabolite transporter (DMT)-like permease
MGFIYIAIVVVGITTVAYLSKLSAKHNVPSLDFTFVLFSAACILGYFFAQFNHVHATAYTSELWYIAAIAGIGGATAVFVFNQAVKCGHFGYSNAIYRSSFLIPVLLSVIAFKSKIDSITISGIFSILISIILVSWSDKAFSRSSGNIRWFLLIICAFLMSGLPRIGQLLTSHNKLNSPAYLFASYAAGSLMLLIVFLFRRRGLKMRALIYGSIAAIASFAGVYFTIEALKSLSAAIVFPVTLSAPIMLGMLISYSHKERITPSGWIGILLGICGILVLSFQTYFKY